MILSSLSTWLHDFNTLLYGLLLHDNHAALTIRSNFHETHAPLMTFSFTNETHAPSNRGSLTLRAPTLSFSFHEASKICLLLCFSNRGANMNNCGALLRKPVSLSRFSDGAVYSKGDQRDMHVRLPGPNGLSRLTGLDGLVAG